ncbi:MAG: hypothetical protein NZ772_12880 [Cyanobacteria bacterium]|nr:hypothetical protein [Cyanobacteriota bacterium]MDW8202277.1 hypothetical protein [Cyanobacteriota bacterium SKYGB_h_bin112]
MVTVIRSQAAKVWQLLTDSDTIATYGQALKLTWSLIKEIGRLLWLLFCAVLVGIAWLLGTSLWAGKAFRELTEKFNEPSSEPLLNQVGKGIVAASKTSVNLALTTAMEQLGITETPKAIQDVMLSVEPPVPSAPLPAAVESSQPVISVTATSSEPAQTPDTATSAETGKSDTTEVAKTGASDSVDSEEA